MSIIKRVIISFVWGFIIRFYLLGYLILIFSIFFIVSLINGDCTKYLQDSIEELRDDLLVIQEFKNGEDKA